MAVGLTEAEFRALFDDHHRPLRAYVARRVRNAMDAEDVVIEVFTVLWRRRDDLPSTPTDQRMWLYGVARLSVANQRRGAARSDRLRARLWAQPNLSLLSPADGDLNDTSVALSALAGLSGNDQELIRLAVWEELNHAEIARVVDTSTPNVAVRLHRARRRLRREFDRRVQETGNTRHEETKR